jgi:large subunit ribosomal protein L19
MHSPKIQKIVRVREGKVRRAKLYYIRNRYGKAAKVAELIRKRRDMKVPETGTAEAAETAAAEGQEKT